MKLIGFLLAGLVAGAVCFWLVLDRQGGRKGDLIRVSNPAVGISHTVVRTESFNRKY